MSNSDINLDEIFAEMDRAAERARQALEGRFQAEYRELRALTPEQIDGVTPNIEDQVQYERLIALVEEASRKNLSQAQLVERIRALGDVAVTIARKSSALARILV